MNSSTGGDVFSLPEQLFDKLVWIDAKEAAIRLRIFTKDGKPSVGAIRNLVYRGKLRRRKPGKKLLFRAAEIDQLAESQP